MGRFLLGLSTGAHATSGLKDSTNHIELIAVKAFRIEPDMTQAGSVIFFFFNFQICLTLLSRYMTVDGEHVEYGTIQAEIFPGLSRIMVP